MEPKSPSPRRGRPAACGSAEPGRRPKLSPARGRSSSRVFNQGLVRPESSISGTKGGFMGPFKGYQDAVLSSSGWNWSPGITRYEASRKLFLLKGLQHVHAEGRSIRNVIYIYIHIYIYMCVCLFVCVDTSRTRFHLKGYLTRTTMHNGTMM